MWCIAMHNCPHVQLCKLDCSPLQHSSELYTYEIILNIFLLLRNTVTASVETLEFIQIEEWLLVLDVQVCILPVFSVYRLHGLLKKLQSIAADPKPPDDTPAGSQKSDETQEEIEEEELLIRPEHGRTIKFSQFLHFWKFKLSWIRFIDFSLMEII